MKTRGREGAMGEGGRDKRQLLVSSEVEMACKLRQNQAEILFLGTMPT